VSVSRIQYRDTAYRIPLSPGVVAYLMLGESSSSSGSHLCFGPAGRTWSKLSDRLLKQPMDDVKQQFPGQNQMVSIHAEHQCPHGLLECPGKVAMPIRPPQGCKSIPAGGMVIHRIRSQDSGTVQIRKRNRPVIALNPRPRAHLCVYNMQAPDPL